MYLRSKELKYAAKILIVSETTKYFMRKLCAWLLIRIFAQANHKQHTQTTSEAQSVVWELCVNPNDGRNANTYILWKVLKE